MAAYSYSIENRDSSPLCGRMNYANRVLRCLGTARTVQIIVGDGGRLHRLMVSNVSVQEEFSSAPFGARLTLENSDAFVALSMYRC